jgi:hypothetical protein
MLSESKREADALKMKVARPESKLDEPEMELEVLWSIYLQLHSRTLCLCDFGAAFHDTSR